MACDAAHTACTHTHTHTKHTHNALAAQSIIKAYRMACEIAVAKIKELSISLEGKGPAEKIDLLKKCAQTTLNSKLVSGEKEFFAQMVVDAVSSLDPELVDLKVSVTTGAFEAWWRLVSLDP